MPRSGTLGTTVLHTIIARMLAEEGVMQLLAAYAVLDMRKRNAIDAKRGSLRACSR
jgi:hypothetical protein